MECFSISCFSFPYSRFTYACTWNVFVFNYFSDINASAPSNSSAPSSSQLLSSADTVLVVLLVGSVNTSMLR